MTRLKSLPIKMVITSNGSTNPQTKMNSMERADLTFTVKGNFYFNLTPCLNYAICSGYMLPHLLCGSCEKLLSLVHISYNVPSILNIYCIN